MAHLVTRVGGLMKRDAINVEDLETLTVGQVRAKASSLSGIKEDRVNLLYGGKLLTNDKDSVKDLGIKKGSMIHVLKKPKEISIPPMEPKDMTNADLQQFVTAFGVAMKNPALSTVMKRLNIRENLESLAAACPGLATDPVALSLISKPEVLIVLFTPEIIKKMGKLHPSLLEAMTNIAAAVHEEPHTAPGDDPQNDIFHYLTTSYDDDGDDMDEDEDEDGEGAMEVDQAGQGGGLRRNRSSNGITRAELAETLMRVQNELFRGNASASEASVSTPAAPATASISSPQPSGSGITPAMLSAAMAQALASVGGSNVSDAKIGESKESEQTDAMQTNIAKMKEMGIQDEGLARKALTVMNGDLQAAIDLIFSGWLGEDESAN